MIVLFANDHQQHDPAFELYDGRQEPYAEKAERITKLLSACKQLGLPLHELTNTPDAAVVKAMHDSVYVNYIRSKSGGIAEHDQLIPSVFIKDTYTPLTRHTYKAALTSAGIAMSGAEKLQRGEHNTVYALCRPPGHHAEHNAMSGYCYFNNAALAAQELSKHGKVAILDVDYHHGNGTQHLFYDRSDVMYVSLHADPSIAFPYSSGFAEETGTGDGKGFTRNFPLSPDTTPEQYTQTLDLAIEVVREFEPAYVVLSLGFDTYKHDPIGNLNLNEETYNAIGELLADNLPRPTLIVQEGGYNINKLGELAKHFFTGYIKLQA